MSVRAQIVVPVKGFAAGKTRLAAALDDADRIALLRRLTERTVAIAVALPEVHVVVVSPDPDVAAFAADLGATAVHRRDDGLNEALTAVARTLPERRTLILPIDLPLLEPCDIEAHIACDGVGLSPDARETGTNLLSVPAPLSIRFGFGDGSRDRHARRARDAGLQFHLIRRPGLAFDLDTPDDLLRLGDWP